jgi:uncharacterized protein with NRDE domain
VCVLVVAWRVVPGTPVFLGANRDEFLDRPAISATVLNAAAPRIVGGQDLRSGGTWLAVNQHGVFAGLTNQPFTGERDPAPRTRGELPLTLAMHSAASAATESLLTECSPADYHGSWLLVGDRDSLFYIDFTGQSDPAAVELAPGIHVLENRPLGASSPKAEHVVRSLGSLTGDLAYDRECLTTVLSDHFAPEVPEDGPRASANCVHLDGYGTRSSCMVRCGDDPTTTPQIWVADGAPCRTPFEDVSALWEQS